MLFPFTLFFLLLFPLQLCALTPPLSEKMLQEEAELIVLGNVAGPVRNEGIVERHTCADTVKYVAPLKVLKVCKGKASPGQTLNVIIYYKNYKQGCVGDQDAWINQGDQGLYYLRQDQEKNWRPVSWNAVKLKEEKGPMPRCP